MKKNKIKLNEKVVEFGVWIKKNGYKKKFLAKKLGMCPAALYQALKGHYSASQPVINLMVTLMQSWTPNAKEAKECFFQKNDPSLRRIRKK